MSEEDTKAPNNSEAKFAFPENNTGIGYYFEGEQVSPEQFDRLVSEEADRIQAAEDAARAGREEEGEAQA